MLCRSVIVLLLFAMLLELGSVKATKGKKKGKAKKEGRDGSESDTSGSISSCPASEAESFEAIMKAGSALFNRDHAAAEDCEPRLLPSDRAQPRVFVYTTP
jgi:hypothetical protein